MTYSTTWKRGETREFEVYCYDENGVAEDLTSAVSLELEVKAERGGADPALISKSIGSGITLLDQGAPATKGRARIVIDYADTASDSTPEGAYMLDVVLTMPGSPQRRSYVVGPDRIFLVDTVNNP